MNEKGNKAIPEMHTIKEIAEFWDTHSVADYWDQTEPAEFEVSPYVRGRYLVPVDPDVLLRVQKIAHHRGVSTESLVNLWLEQRLHKFEIHESEKSALSLQPA